MYLLVCVLVVVCSFGMCDVLCVLFTVVRYVLFVIGNMLCVRCYLSYVICDLLSGYVLFGMWCVFISWYIVFDICYSLFALSTCYMISL